MASKLRHRQNVDYKRLHVGEPLPLTDCSCWEPENNLPGYLITNFNQPPASESRVKIFSRLFEDAIQRRLRSRNNRVVIQFDSDIYRHLFGGNESGLFFKENLPKLVLSDSWYYSLNSNGCAIRA